MSFSEGEEREGVGERELHGWRSMIKDHNSVCVLNQVQ